MRLGVRHALRQKAAIRYVASQGQSPASGSTAKLSMIKGKRTKSIRHEPIARWARKSALRAAAFWKTSPFNSRREKNIKKKHWSTRFFRFCFFQHAGSPLVCRLLSKTAKYWVVRGEKVLKQQ